MKRNITANCKMALSDILFVIFSMGVTVFQYLVFTFLPGILGIGLAGTEFMWPKVSMNLFGVKFTWSLLGYNVLRDATGEYTDRWWTWLFYQL